MSSSESNQPQNPPLHRADVDRTDIKQRGQKYKNGRRLRKRNSKGGFEWIVTIVSAEYNPGENCWEYTLLDFQGNPVIGKTKETDLGGTAIDESDIKQ